MRKEIKMRNLTNRDLFTVIGMLSKISGQAGEAIRTAFKASDVKQDKSSAQSQEELGIEIGLRILHLLGEHMMEDLQKWFASLLEVSVDEYLDELPPDTTIDLIEELATREDSAAFFQKAFALYKKMNKSASTSGKK